MLTGNSRMSKTAARENAFKSNQLKEPQIRGVHKQFVQSVVFVVDRSAIFRGIQIYLRI